LICSGGHLVHTRSNLLGNSLQICAFFNNFFCPGKHFLGAVPYLTGNIINFGYALQELLASGPLLFHRVTDDIFLISDSLYAGVNGSKLVQHVFGR
jgi:hypothetical protein